MKQQMADTQIIKWIQPANKKEQCKVFVGTSKDDDRTIKHDYKIYWDGQCKDGYAYGLGREIEKGFLTDMEAIAMYSGEKKEPDYYYQKCNLQNMIMEGDITNGYFVQTNIKDESLNFRISYSYGYNGRGANPSLMIASSPMEDNVLFFKNYPNFTYKIYDMTNNEFNIINYVFEPLLPSGKTNGFVFAISKNQEFKAFEDINGVRIREVILPQSYTAHIGKILDEIKEAGQKAINAQQTAIAVKKQYKQRICSDSVSVDFMDNKEYKAICEEDKYFAEVKTKLDAELAKIETAKQQQRIRLAQERGLRAQEAQARAAQRQASAAEQANINQSLANFNQSMANMNQSAMMNLQMQNQSNMLNNQLQQLNNNLFMLRNNNSNSNIPPWLPVTR